jgi:ribosomal protein S20
MNDKEAQAALLRAIENWQLKANAKSIYRQFIDAVEAANAKKEGAIPALQEACEPVYKAIEDHVFSHPEVNPFLKSIPAGTTFYRARAISADQIVVKADSPITLEGFDDGNSREPMVGLAGEGRVNPLGSSYLYVANNAETACAEIKTSLRTFISVARFTIAEPMKVVDFASDQQFPEGESTSCGFSLGEFFTLLMAGFFEPVEERVGYRPNQIVGDYIRKHRVDGIMYRSFLSVGGLNYAFFNCHRDYFNFEGPSQIYLHYSSQESFWSLCDGTAHFASAGGNGDYDAETAEDIRKRLLAPKPYGARDA